MRSAPGRILPAIALSGDSNAQPSVNSPRKKMAPSSRMRSRDSSNDCCPTIAGERSMGRNVPLFGTHRAACVALSATTP